MIIGIVSDIHSDALALRRVLDAMPPTELLLCPGDAVSEYRFCPDTVAILQEENVQCIQGNHEIVLFGGRNPAYLKNARKRLPQSHSRFSPMRHSPESSIVMA